jgi:pimeloyl-ACP methyl ester carboxylesterase/DNA-binding SARP family transcriptional activator
MRSVPPTRYARSGDVSLAYQVFGDGPVTIVSVPPLAKNIEIAWECPQYCHYFERLGSFGRYVHFDKRGTGASDRTALVPSLDTHVDDLRAVLDAAGVERAFIQGVSEGGPMAMLFAVTYPERVAGLILDSTAATIFPRDESTEAKEQRLASRELWLDRWGTERSLTLAAMAPSVAADPWYRGWQPRYERQSASPSALRDVVAMADDIDVSAVLPSIDVPTLARHRVGDAIISIDMARETIGAIRGARLVEFPGGDHFVHTGDDVDAWLDVVQEFTTGARMLRPTSRRLPRAHPRGVTTIRTLGGFSVVVGDQAVPIAAWGSRRSRQLCKMLACARGQPVAREELIDALWPDGTVSDRLSARLSVQLSTVRRILGGGIIADRDSIRLDLREVRLDVDDLHQAADAGVLTEVLNVYRGEFLPEDPYEDWAAPARDLARRVYVRTVHGLVAQAATAGDHERAADLAGRIVQADPFDETGHHRLITALASARRLGEARHAYDTYAARMKELGVPCTEFSALIGSAS